MRLLASVFCVNMLLTSALPLFGQDAFEWRVVRYGELKVGRACITRSEVKKGAETLYRTDVERELAYFQGKDVRLTTRETFLERDDGSIVELSYSGVAEAGKTSITGAVEGGKVRYLVQSPGEKPKEMELAWPSETIGPRRAERLLREKGYAPRTRVQFTMYSFAVSAPVKMDFIAAGKETLRIGGAERAWNRLDFEGDDLKGVSRTRWVDDAGAFGKEWDPCLGGRSEEACTEAQAAAIEKGVVAQYPTWGNAPVTGTVIRPRAVTGASILVSGHAALAGWPFGGPGQMGARQEGGAVVLTVRVPPRPASPARLPVASKEMAPFLASNYFLDFDAEGMRALAEKASGGEKDAGKAAEAIRAWVGKTLARRPLNAGMAAASTAIARGEGDAVEHAVVVAALCRAVGVPARIVGGLLVAGGYATCHAWTEAWTGAWTPLDATQENSCDAMRIRFAESHLNDSSPEAVLLALAGMAASLRLEIQAYQLAGVLVDPRDPNKGAHRTEGDSYYHVLYGFGFTKPREFRFVTALQGIDGGVISAEGRGGSQERILFRIGPAGSYTLDTALAAMERNFDVQILSRPTVGGFPAVIAKTGLKGRGGFAPMICMILAGDTIYTAESTDTTPDVKAGFELVLKTLYFK